MSESIDVAIGIVDGKVIAQWKDQTNEIAFDPKNAYQVGMALSRAAMEAHNGRSTGKETEFIAGELAQVKVVVTDLQRMAMVQQVATIIRSLLDRGMKPGAIANHCVDVVLRETAR